MFFSVFNFFLQFILLYFISKFRKKKQFFFNSLLNLLIFEGYFSHFSSFPLELILLNWKLVGILIQFFLEFVIFQQYFSIFPIALLLLSSLIYTFLFLFHIYLNIFFITFIHLFLFKFLSLYYYLSRLCENIAKNFYSYFLNLFDLFL